MPLIANSLRTVSAALITASLIIATIVLGREILVPLALAGISCFVLVPAVRWLRRRCLPEGVAVALVLLSVSGLLLAGSVALSSQLLSLAADLPQYRTNVLDKVRSVVGNSTPSGIVGRAIDAVESYRDMLDRELKLGADAPQPVAPQDTVGETDGKPDTKTIVVNDSSEGPAWRGLRILAEPLAQIALTFLFTLFLLLQYKDLRDRVVRVFGTDNMSETTAAMSDAGDRLSDLFVGQAILNASFGVVVGVVLMIVGVPNAPLWGAVAFVMRFVPFVGSYIAAIPPILLAAAVDPGWTKTVCTLALFAIGEPIMGQVLEPHILGKRAGLSPFAMVLSTSFWTLAWGPIGLVLAAPLTLVLVVLGKYIPNLEFITVLLGDEPPLSPQQDLYHSLLAGDVYGAVGQLEEADAGIGRVGVLDRVVFPALMLAARDRRRGRLDAESWAELQETISEMVTRSARGKKPENPRLLLVAARGPLDVLAAEFAVDALNDPDDPRAGASAESGLTALASIDPKGGANIGQIAFVTVTGVAAKQIEFMARRARQLFPKAKIQLLDLTRPAGMMEQNPLPAEVLTSFRALADFVSGNGEGKEPARARPQTVGFVSTTAASIEGVA